MERFALAPAIDLEVAIERENLGCPKFVCQVDETRIREIDFAISIFSQDWLYGCGLRRKLKRELENTRSDIFDRGFRSPRKIS